MRLQSVLYATLNPIVAGLLRSPLHGIASDNYGIKLDRDRNPRKEDVAHAAGHVVLVEVELAT